MAQVFIILFLCWFMVSLVLMSYATAVMFDAYIKAQQRIVVEAQQEQQLNLFATFAAITKDRTMRSLESMAMEVPSTHRCNLRPIASTCLCKHVHACLHTGAEGGPTVEQAQWHTSKLAR